MLIHRYWTGPDPPDGCLLDDEIPGDLTAWLDERMAWVHTRPLHHRANMVRWWLLFVHGGTWADRDILVPYGGLPPFPFALWDVDRFRVGVMGFPPNHPVPVYALDKLADPPPAPMSSRALSGSVLLREAIAHTGTLMHRFLLP